MFLIEIVEMVSFELGEGLRKIFLSCHERGISVGAQNLPSLLFFIKNITLIDIADPNSVWEACYKNFVIDLAHRRVFVAQWLSIGAQIRRSEVRFLMETQNISFTRARDKTKKHLSYLNAFGNIFEIFPQIKYFILFLFKFFFQGVEWGVKPYYRKNFNHKIWRLHNYCDYSKSAYASEPFLGYLSPCAALSILCRLIFEWPKAFANTSL